MIKAIDNTRELLTQYLVNNRILQKLPVFRRISWKNPGDFRMPATNEQIQKANI